VPILKAIGAAERNGAGLQDSMLSDSGHSLYIVGLEWWQEKLHVKFQFLGAVSSQECYVSYCRSCPVPKPQLCAW